MKENYSQFESALGKEAEERIELSLRAQELLELRIRNRIEAFKEANGRNPKEVDLEKLLKGVRSLLVIDHRDAVEEDDKPEFEKAIKYVESDLDLNEMRRFFETYERRSEPRD
jgi:hypothetical protein